MSLEEASGEVRLVFAYEDEAIRELVRQLPRRRFDRPTRAWYVPAEYAGELLEDLAEFAFEIEPAVRQAAERGGRNAMIRRMRRSARRDGLTVAQINAQTQRALKAVFPGETWIVGQIANLRGNYGKNAYFDLVEQYEGESQPRAVIRAVAFPKTVERLEATLAAMNPPLKIQNNLQIKVAGRVRMYERRGTFNVEIIDIDPQYTVIQLNRRREAILQALDELGLSEKNLNLTMPGVPLRVALITSAGSDAYRDFVDELSRSGFGFEVSVLDARVQGAQLEPTVLKALRWCARNADKLDVVAIVRGGGSRLDLEGFDSYAVGEAVCRLPVPVVVGIGHHADVSVLDDLARSFKTPTAAAQALVALVSGFAEELAGLTGKLGERASQLHAQEAEALDRLARDVAREARHRLETTDARLVSLGGELGHVARARLEGAGAALDTLSERAVGASRRRLRGERRLVGMLGDRLGPRRFLLELAREGDRLALLRGRLTRGSGRAVSQARVALAEVGPLKLERAAADLIFEAERTLELVQVRVEARDPARVLERGYAWVTDERGAVVRDAQGIAEGQPLKVRLAQGEMAVTRSPATEDAG